MTTPTTRNKNPDPNSPKLTPQERSRRGGQAVYLKYGSGYMSENGKKGCQASEQKLGARDFHVKGGQATAKLDGYTDPQTGAVGREALRAQGWEPRKQHRYLGSCKCHSSST